MATKEVATVSEGFGGLRAFPVRSDNMEPTFRRGDFAIVIPVSGYEGEGVYVTMDQFETPVLHRFEACGGGRIRLWSDNPLYTRYDISLADFRAIVLAKVVLRANVMDRRLLPQALRH